LESPMLFAMGFISVFVIGGITGVMVASLRPVWWQCSRTLCRVLPLVPESNGADV
jgi:cytochrome c biogenesis protein CcdA